MLTVFSAVASASASVSAGPDQLWSQLAALPILALQSHREQPAEVVTAVADGITESVEKSLFLHMTDEAVVAICANKTAELASRLSAALEKDEDPAAPGSAFPEQRAAADILLAAAAPSNALQPPATASSHLELASSPTFGGMAAGAAEATTDALEHVWRLLPDLLMQSIDTQALEALNSMHATALNFAEATLSISDDLAHHRVPAVSGVRAHGANLMQQLLTLSGAWSPGAPAMVQSIVQEQIMAPLNQSSAMAARRLHELTGEDVGASFEIMLERTPGNKVDALQTILRAVLRLYRNGLLQLLADARAVVTPWQHNLTAASLSVVDSMRNSSIHSIRLLEDSIDAPALTEAMRYYIEPKTARALVDGVHAALKPLQAQCDAFAAQMSAALADALEGALGGALDEINAGSATAQQEAKPAAGAGAAAGAASGKEQLLDKMSVMTRSAFGALHTSLSRPANSTSDLSEVHDNMVRGVRATLDRLSAAARLRLRDSVRHLKRSYAQGVRRMARTLTAELLVGMRTSLTAAGSCARVHIAAEAPGSLFA